MAMELQTLIPYDAREALTLSEAARIARRSETTLKTWCSRHFIGRRVVGGPWQVSAVALAMLLDGNDAALIAYLAGDRSGALVCPYFERAGLLRDRGATDRNCPKQQK
jgi:hypothetical protein